MKRKIYTKRFLALTLCTLLAIPLYSCTKEETEASKNVLVSSTSKTTTTDVDSEDLTEEEDEDSDGAYKIDTYIILNDEKTTINGNGATFENSVLTVSQPGTYSIEGSLTDGNIVVNSTDTEKKVKLYFDGVTIASTTTAPLYVEESPRETIVILADSSVNNLSDNSDRTVPTDDTTDYATSVIYSKDDLQIEGTGTLNIAANFNKGIFSKDDLQIKGGTINITSVDDGIRGKDSVEISDGTINITSGGDAIRTSNTEETEKGNLTISGGTINVTSELDGIQSVNNLTISGGSINVTSGGGSTGNYSSNPQPSGRGGIYGIYSNDNSANQPNNSSAYEAINETEISTKGLKAENTLTVSGGIITVSSLDDAIHCDDNVSISGGTLSVKSDDDGIHTENTLSISSGEINVENSYEGLEGNTINISGGNISVTASDDGINAAPSDAIDEDETTTFAATDSAQAIDTDSSSPSATNLAFFGKGQGGGNMGGGNMGGGMGDYASSCQINISGGYLVVNADGDGIDSNGDATMSDGTVIVYGPTTGGNGALDYNGSFVITGGTLLASGSTGMAQSVSSQSTVGCLEINCNMSADTILAVLDSSGNCVVGIRSPKSYQSLIFASDKLNIGETYSVYSGGSFDKTASDGYYESATYTQGSKLSDYTA